MEVKLGVLVILCGLAVYAQDFSDYKISKVATGYLYVDGPAWSPNGFLVFSDAASNRDWQITPGVKAAVLRENSNGADGNAFDPKGRRYACETHARRVVRIKKGEDEVLADRWDGKRLNAPNDIAVRKDDQVYFTDPAFGDQRYTRELDFYGVYHLSPKKGLAVIAKPKGRPNGITLSPDGKILYVTNSDEKNVRAYDLAKDGEASNERVLISDIPGVPGGIRCDENGNLYVAAARIFIYSPDGRALGSIEVSERPSNLAFGDPDGKTLYVTARTSVYRVRLDVKGANLY